MRGAFNTRVSDNILDAAKIGVRVISSENVRITGNTVSASEVGVLVLSSDMTMIGRNLIVVPEVDGSGVWVGYSSRTNVIVNTIAAPVGITICDSSETADTQHWTDCAVNIDDLATVGATFGKTSGSPGFDANADLNKDGAINIDDLATVGAKFGHVCS